MAEHELIIRLDTQLDANEARFIKKLTTLRTRLSPRQFFKITITHNGSLLLLRLVASIQAVDSSRILIQPFDPTLLNAIDEAVRASGLELVSSKSEGSLQVSIPPLSDERRKELSNKLVVLTDQHRTKVRFIAAKGRKGIVELLNDGSITKAQHDTLHVKVDVSQARSIAGIDAQARKVAGLT
ncbi:ribosome-recycling factor [Myxococcus hansupus]|uniref:ribosome-recycling factor n=1 Tax=Pseudomyxococcus hansupus TaxID=1297742 RepID=UPI0009E5BB3E|nr:ribosome-recycling factor [Myxococcus hansupus]